MKPQNLHAHEDRLLDFAYGELPAQEARVVESHLQGCTRCTELLDGIRGVRTTMAQLPMEPAPDAGLDSLLAYAQQAARNAAAGPAPKPTWWRRWLVPAMGVTAVSAFAILSIQVSGKVNLEPQLTATAQSTDKKEASPVASALPEPAKQAEAAMPAAPMQAMPEPQATPPSEPVAKLDTSTREKFNEAPRKKTMRPGATYDSTDGDWSNAGAGLGRAAERDAEASKDYAYDRRDAMTQAGAFPKPKPLLVPRPAETASAAPAPAPTAAPVQIAAPPPPPAAAQPGGMPADEYVATAEEAPAAEAEVQQQGPSRGGLRLSESKRDAAKTASNADDSFDSLFGSAPKAKREQRTVASAPAPAKPSAGAASTGRAENQGPSSAELSTLATAAMRKGDRVREALYLRQALNAGATGNERLGLLNRLCDAEFATGRRDAAIDACTLVVEEAPRSSAAQVARRRLEQEAPAQAKPDSRLSAPKSASPLRADDMEAPAQAAPAESR